MAEECEEGDITPSKAIRHRLDRSDDCLLRGWNHRRLGLDCLHRRRLFRAVLGVNRRCCVDRFDGIGGFSG